ncbi:MAG: T9SS type A sorting domain-containing protein, partial [Flavobacteriales bacterium]
LLQTFNTQSSGSGTRLNIGSGYYARNNNESSHGRINEYIIYNKALSATEILKVEAYLAAKYGLQLNTAGGGTNGDLVSSGGTTYWDASANTGYSNEVVVIGKDNNSGLTQKQAKSADDSTRVFVSTLKASNAANTGTITNDQSFIAIGHNGAKLKANYASNLEKPVGINSRLAREWKVTNTNFANNFSIEVEWDSAGAVNLADLRLLVDDDGNFSNATAYSSANGLTFAFGSIIVSGISTSMIPLNSTKYITIGSSSASTPLPVQLTSFEGKTIEDGVLLTWQTASEINNEKFILEKSFDANNWFQIAEIKGAGNSNNILNYSFVDDALILGIQYYRLTQVDFDGTKETFEIIDVASSSTATNDLKVFPNPMKEEVKVMFNTSIIGYARFKIYSESGQEIYSALVATVKGENVFNFNTSQFSEGIYLFKIEKEDGSFISKKVLK